jgi:hypothetical protein
MKLHHLLPPSSPAEQERADSYTALAFALADYDRSETTDEEAHHAERVAELVRHLLITEGVVIP